MEHTRHEPHVPASELVVPELPPLHPLDDIILKAIESSFFSVDLIVLPSFNLVLRRLLEDNITLEEFEAFTERYGPNSPYKIVRKMGRN